MAKERGAYTARVLPPIEAALPAHAHIDEDLSGRKWTATWTTPDGTWQVAWRDPQLDATVIAVTGPRVQLRQEYPPDGALVLHLLVARGAVTAPPFTTVPAEVPTPPKDWLRKHTDVSDRAAAGAGWQEGWLAGRAAALGRGTAESSSALEEPA